MHGRKPNYVAHITATTHPHLFTEAGLGFGCRHELELRHPLGEMAALHQLQANVRADSRVRIVEIGKGSLAIRSWVERNRQLSLMVLEHTANARRKFRHSVGETISWEADLSQCSDFAETADICFCPNPGVKNVTNPKFLQGMHSLLSPNGKLILSQEFLPDYKNSEEWIFRTIVYYAAIIDRALNSEQWRIAEDATEKLLQTLVGQRQVDKDALLTCVHKYVHAIYGATWSKSAKVGHIISRFLDALSKLQPLSRTSPQFQPESTCMVSARKFEQKATEVGFKIRERSAYQWQIGPIAQLTVYDLDKKR